VIGVRELIQQAAFVAHQTMMPPGKNIAVRVEGADIRLPSQPATTLAIAVNELIQNALEHGYDNIQQGTVDVSLSETRTHYTVRVQDDGAGLPKQFPRNEPSPQPSLGLRIVEGLAEDLRGEFKITNRRGKRGTTATLRIPKMRVSPRFRPKYGLVVP
jgi:two-component sensor histidine kinase